MKWFWLLLFVFSCSKMRKDSSQQEDAEDTNPRDRWEEEAEDDEEDEEDDEEEDEDEEEDRDEAEEDEELSGQRSGLNNEGRGFSPERGNNNRRRTAASPAGKQIMRKKNYTITIQDTTDSGILHSLWFMAFGEKGATKQTLLQVSSENSKCVLLKEKDFASLSVIMDFEVENSKKEQAVCHNFAPAPTYEKCTPNGMAGSFILKISNDCPGFCLLKRDEWKYTVVPGNSAPVDSTHCSRLQ